MTNNLVDDLLFQFFKMSLFKEIKHDLPASIIVFFVALPLCLGIALASGAPLFSGLIAGIIGGIIVGSLSGSPIGVSGPAAGLAAIVLTAITDLGGWENFLVAVVIGGVIQIVFGVLRLGIIGYYFPSSVIKGMLTGIGVIIILKQIPYFFGIDKNPEGDFAFLQIDGENTFTELLKTLNALLSGNFDKGATIIALIAMAILILWSNVLSKKGRIFQLVQGPLVAVVVGIVYFLTTKESGLGLSMEHLVSVPVPESFSDVKSLLAFPNFEVITNSKVLLTGFTIALIASLETLLCVEATDKLDPQKRVTPTNRELLAQGTGNVISGLLGGLPVTQVIVRSSANIQSGGRTKLSAIMHGFLLLISVIAIPQILNYIPLSVLAAILFIVGYKLAKPSLFKSMYKLGPKQFVPFIVTIIGIVFTDLLTGIGIGVVIAVIIILRNNYRNSHFMHIKERDDDQHHVTMTLSEEVTFLNKGAILQELDKLPNGTEITIDMRKSVKIDYDVYEIIANFMKYNAVERDIKVTVLNDKEFDTADY